MRKLLLSIAAVAAIVIPAAPASAEEIHLPHVGSWGCGVNGGTVSVLEPDHAVAYDDFYVDVYFCLPPP
ncbi:MAG TPA: hypothetical protein VEU29_04785 [Actinomycetota bacterium]|nr:hypothetical protein [Actinomycetota bacterium]